MSNIFLNNILALETKNAGLSKRIQSNIPKEIPQLVNENGAYNLLYKGKHVHNPINPLGEANEIFSLATNEPVSIHLVYGLGLGYLFQVASLHSQGVVILYEPDLTILQIAFSLVDFSKDIMKPNIYITDNYDEVSEYIYKHKEIKNVPQMLSIPSQNQSDPEKFQELVLNLQNLVGSFNLDLKYTKEKFYPSLKMLIQNIPCILNEKPLVHYKDSYKGKTALVISAGPTLDRNIETIKKYRDNVVIFTVGTALKTLIKNDIKPDFLCIIETFDSTKQFEGIDLSNVNFITEPYSHPNLRNGKFKQIFSHIAANAPINHLWAEICGENIEEYWSKGTVSYTALNSARVLGCDKIILVGQDLAYVEGQCYSKDSAYKDLVCQYNSELKKWEIVAKDFEKFAEALSNYGTLEEREAAAIRRLGNLNNSLYYVKGISGEMIPTESVYAAFVKPLSEFVEKFNDRKYINTSLVGAQIDGFENMPLEDALIDSSSVGDLALNSDFEYNKEQIINNLRGKLNELKEANSIIKRGKGLAKSLKNDIQRYKSPTNEVLKSLKALSLNYISLSVDFAEKSKLYDFITASDKIDLDYEMKMMKEFTVDTITNMCEKISLYYQNGQNRINEIEGLINNVLEKIG
ncbi:MAG: DUF115 domain-containing protein [bacterium]|nr:DUF115 domain-containing protein [bacterium]